MNDAVIHGLQRILKTLKIHKQLLAIKLERDKKEIEKKIYRYCTLLAVYRYVRSKAKDIICDFDNEIFDFCGLIIQTFYSYKKNHLKKV